MLITWEWTQESVLYIPDKKKIQADLQMRNSLENLYYRDHLVTSKMMTSINHQLAVTIIFQSSKLCCCYSIINRGLYCHLLSTLLSKNVMMVIIDSGRNLKKYCRIQCSTLTLSLSLPLSMHNMIIIIFVSSSSRIDENCLFNDCEGFR